MDNTFLEISVIMAIAVAVAALMQVLRQPLIIGHIITGIIVGPSVLNVLHANDTLELFSHIGLALLLFIIGLSLNPVVVKEVGKVSLVVGCIQVIATTAAGFFVAQLLGFSDATSWFIGAALSFSSTIIILKLLSDKKELGRLYGKIATGLLLVQDIVAAILLIFVTAVSADKDFSQLASDTAIRVSALAVAFWLFTRLVLPRLNWLFGRSQEFLFLFSIAWGLGIAAVFSAAGLSLEIGALFAGVTLATSPYSYEITARLKPLRDFFVVVFFILLGAGITISNAFGMMTPIIALSAFVLILKPLIIVALIGIMGYTKKTSFKAGLAMAQISEFSLVLLVLGSRLGQIPESVVAMVTMVGLVTIAVSSYLITYADGLYKIQEPFLSIFERKKTRSERSFKGQPEVVLFGYKRAGFQFVKSFKKLNKDFVVVDFDPEVIDRLEQEDVACLYGDANSSELLATLGLSKVKIVISTISDYSANALILHTVRQANKDALVVVDSDSIEEAAHLYAAGATYVMMPHYLGSQHTSGMIERHGFDLSMFIKEREKHLDYLDQRRELA